MASCRMPSALRSCASLPSTSGRTAFQSPGRWQRRASRAVSLQADARIVPAEGAYDHRLRRKLGLGRTGPSSQQTDGPAFSEVDGIPACTSGEWRKLNTSWDADCSSLPVDFGPDPPRMQLQLLLLSDGSLTRHLQILSGSPIEVAVLAEDTVSLSACSVAGPSASVPPECAAIGDTLVQRRVVLRSAAGGAAGPPLAYATSWWSEEAYRRAIRETGKPIWLNLAASRTETLREMKRVYRGRSPELEAAFGGDQDLWGRHYVFYHGGKILTCIYEVFSPAIYKY